MEAHQRYPQQRDCTRVRVPITALVTLGGVTLRAPVRDLCLQGIGLRVDTSMQEGAACTVELRSVEAPDEPWIVARGIVVHAAPETAGIRFVELLGVESLNALRALILYHADDPDQILTEFDSHWGLRRKGRAGMTGGPGAPAAEADDRRTDRACSDRG